MGWIAEQWDDVKYTLSQRKAWEIVTALILIVLAIASVVFCFIFTIVIPPGQSGSNAVNAAQHQQQAVPMLFKRSILEPPKPADDIGMRFASRAEFNDALICAEIGSDALANGATPSEAASQSVLCIGRVFAAERETIASWEKDLATVLSTGNSHAAVNILLKMIQDGIVEESETT